MNKSKQTKSMKRLLTMAGFVLITAASSQVYAQNGVGINPTGAPADPSAALDVSATNKGVLVPRMTEAEKVAIASPANGLLIYQTDGVTGFWYYNGSIWVQSVGPQGATGPQGPSGSLNAWSLIGNANTVDGTNFIGTTDDIPFTIRVNNEKAGRIGASAEGNTFYGYQSGNSNTGDNYNTGIGQQALYSNTTGGNNTASGVYALYSNTTGNNNTASGMQALNSNTTGISNTASGKNALFSNTEGIYNTASGVYALYSNTTGSNNTASGVYALYSNTEGGLNTASGMQALYSNTTGFANTANGNNALYSNTTGYFNTASGQGAGSLITTGSNNIAIGYNAQVPSATGSNQIRIGNAGINYAGVQVAWTTTSDKRWKSDIQPSNLGLDFITKLKPVSYTRNNDERKKREYGFIAQDLEETLNSSGASDNGIISKDDAGMYGVRYNDLMSPMVKAIQEQQAQIEESKKQIEELKKQNAELLSKMNELLKK